MNLKKILISLTVLLSCLTVFSQENIEYLGVLQLNDSSFISYRINLTRKKDSLFGYSVTDFGGPFETKSLVKGEYNEETNDLSFEENGIVYTKSPVNHYDFCFIHFKGTMRKLNQNKRIKGSFEGRYPDGTGCINGKIELMGFEKIAKKAERVDKKIQRLKKLSDDKKKQISVAKTLDTLKMNRIKKNEVLSIFSSAAKAKIIIYDAGKEDGDLINLSVDGKLILENFTVLKKHKVLEISLKNKKTTVTIEALNVGTSAPNTVKVEVIDNKNFIKTVTDLDAGDHASIDILKK
ncbi:hypothetical protein ACG2LH_01410 [Zhouia sp. PK063]|uniref:hypothetical protein n=1 Tax=Zhouia sp. PK063 TaxID=3373602 RepID=UPI0037ABCA92